MDSKFLTITPARFSAIKIAIDKKLSALDKTDIDVITQTEKAKQDGAIWIHIVNKQTHHIGIITELGYRFHHYDDAIGEYVYYKWNNPIVPDKVPKYATSIGGAAAIILSKNEEQVFLVFEYGKFKCVTGSVDCGELSLTTAQREVGEETSIKLDPSFVPKICGLWNISSARPGNINDTLICYVVKAKSDEFKLDTFEVSDGRWFDISFLMQAYNSLPADKTSAFSDLTSDFMVYNDVKLSICALTWLNNYILGRKFDCHISKDGKINLAH